MLTLRIKKTRSDPSVPFYFEIKKGTVFLLKYLHDNYVKTGQMRHVQKWEISEDGLVAEMIQEWISEEAYQKWSNDVVVKEHVLDPMQIYEIEHDITSEILGLDE